VRPTSERARAAIFNVLPPWILEDARVLDLFAGTGSLGIEALSRGAAWGDFVERNRRQHRALQANLESTGFRQRSQAYCADAARILGDLPGPYRLVLLDPPYKMEELDDFMVSLGTTPGLVDESGMVVVGHSRHVALAGEYGDLALESNRRYGDNLLDFYRRGGNGW
jgi:16S rRNA (guanine(966)-N(2))-methyltransferase RsmD